MEIHVEAIMGPETLLCADTFTWKWPKRKKMWEALWHVVMRNEPSPKSNVNVELKSPEIKGEKMLHTY